MNSQQEMPMERELSVDSDHYIALTRTGLSEGLETVHVVD